MFLLSKSGLVSKNILAKDFEYIKKNSGNSLLFRPSKSTSSRKEGISFTIISTSCRAVPWDEYFDMK